MKLLYRVQRTISLCTAHHTARFGKASQPYNPVSNVHIVIIEVIATKKFLCLTRIYNLRFIIL